MRSLSPILFCLAVAHLPACALDPLESEESEDDAEAAEQAASSDPPSALVAVGSGETRVRAGGMSVWVLPRATAKQVGGEVWLTLRLRTSRSLESAMSWVPEDGLGDARLVSPRVVEIDLRGAYEIDTILGGQPLFVHLSTKSGAVRDYDVRLDLSARLTRFTGSSRVFVDAPITPIYWRDGVTNLRYRGHVRSPGAQAMGTKIADKPAMLLVPAGPIGSGRFRFDYDHARFSGGFVPEAAATFTATITGTRYEKRAGVDVVVDRAGSTIEGAEKAWPAPPCAAAVSACIAAQPPAAKDFGACGAHREVARCMPE